MCLGWDVLELAGSGIGLCWDWCMIGVGVMGLRCVGTGKCWDWYVLGRVFCWGGFAGTGVLGPL